MHALPFRRMMAEKRLETITLSTMQILNTVLHLSTFPAP